MTKKYQICHHQIRFFEAQNAQKSVFGRSSAPDPAEGAYDAPPDPLVGWKGDTPCPFPSSPRSTPSASRTRRLRRFGSQAPSTQNPGYASDTQASRLLESESVNSSIKNCYSCIPVTRIAERILRTRITCDDRSHY